MLLVTLIFTLLSFLEKKRKCFLLFFSRKSHKQAKKAHDSHQNDIKGLEKELNDVDEKRQEFEEMVEQESQSQGRELELQDKQVSQSGKTPGIFPGK